MQIGREQISATEKVIRPHIRRTPVIELNGSEFGLDSFPLIFKLELLQHSGSFKARGAFANLLLREIPKAGVVAASGGNHGAAVAYSAMKLGVPAKIFVPTVASTEKMERIRAYGAELVVTGERYAEALAASERWASESGALKIHAYDQIETLLGQDRLVSNSSSNLLISILFSSRLAVAASSAASPPGMRIKSKLLASSPRQRPHCTTPCRQVIPWTAPRQESPLIRSLPSKLGR